ncbi:MAG TPA: roadblock/LC7 domain-containing protein [Geobacterales bacterium]|nr:roadblock/LC7 domain-containing protein [Geobacterales bacterium]
MTLRGRLEAIIQNVEGAIGVVIMGYDGIPIDEYVRPEAGIDMQLLAVEYAAMLHDIRKTIELLKAGEMEEVSINTDRTRVILRPLTPEFFLVLALRPEGNYGKGRYLMGRESAALRQELV